MAWKKTPNVAEFGGASWSNVVAKVSNTTAEQAMRTAFANPAITYFFFCREYMVLEGPAAAYSPFQPGDAVFFTGQPWFGSAPQCDSYQKNAVVTLYVSPSIPQDLETLCNYVQTSGTPSIDVVCLGAGNYAAATPPYLRANNNQPATSHPLNLAIQAALLPQMGLVSALQAKGITVLLTVMNGWANVGWSQFTKQTDAQNFANYLATDVVGAYGIDGIDIDDEYSTGTANNTSLPMVTTLMKQTMPGKLITKALWSDSWAFQGNWNGHTLAANLNYGWEMTYYGGGPNTRLLPYTQFGSGNSLAKNQLVLGFSAETRFQPQWSTIPTVAAEIVPDGYAGGMMFDFVSKQGPGLTQQMVEAMNGPGSWNLG